jgi:hypothetical protein
VITVAAVPARRHRPTTVNSRVATLRAMAGSVADFADAADDRFTADFARAVDVFLAEFDPEALLDPIRNQRIN